jgi:hypothetical protein
VVVLVALPVLAEAPAPDPSQQLPTGESVRQPILGELRDAAIRLPLAALFGAVLALRPRRSGTPPRTAAVVQTQILLAIIGAVVMLVVGASLARAFGILGVASLIRYRSKINDPKDAVVMLAALAVGLTAGVGLYALAAFSTAFLTAALWLIEGFEPRTRIYELTVRLEEKALGLRPRVEEILRRYHCSFEARTVSEAELAYIVTAPYGLRTVSVSKALITLEGNGKGAVEWKEITAKKSK